jgi:hypothetical protein
MTDANGFGAKNWNNTSIRYDQKNNIIEQVFSDLKRKGDLHYYLESCNVEATACAVEAVGARWVLQPPKINGITFMAQGDLMYCFLNSLKVKPLLPAISEFITENEFIENLCYAVPLFSSAYARIRQYDDADDIDMPMIASLKMGCAIVLSYLTDYGSGHYITVVYYDVKKNHFICYDSWADNKHCEHGGVLESYPASFFRTRLQGHRSRFMEVYV